ncbi:MAG: type II toxin-antitoxin system HicA family toxin [bacterium]
MPKLRVLGVPSLIDIFYRFGFVVVGQKGSHIKLRRNIILSGLDVSQSLIIPNHKELSVGTLKAIYNQANKYISESELAPFFFL